MHVLAPDLLEEVRQLPVGAPVLAGAVGLFLWALGGRCHRFWLALGLTATAGTLGLAYGREYGTQPLVAGLLLAVSAGALALSLVRLLLFVAGGIVGVALLRTLAPEWNEPLVSFAGGGLVGVLLYRLWVVVLSSLAGSVLLGYSVLVLADRARKFDSVTWAGQNGPLLNWAVVGTMVVGMLVQFLVGRRYDRKKKKAHEVRKQDRARAKAPPPPPPPPPPEPWWKATWSGMFERKAG